MKKPTLLLSLASICPTPVIAAAQSSILGEDERADQFATCVAARLEKITTGKHLDDRKSRALFDAAFKFCKPDVAIEEIAKRLRAQDPALDDKSARSAAAEQLILVSTMFANVVLSRQGKRDSGDFRYPPPGAQTFPTPPTAVPPSAGPPAKDSPNG